MFQFQSELHRNAAFPFLSHCLSPSSEDEIVRPVPDSGTAASEPRQAHSQRAKHISQKDQINTRFSMNHGACDLNSDQPTFLRIPNRRRIVPGRHKGNECQLSLIRERKQSRSCCFAPGEQMLRTDLVPSRHLRNNCSRAIRLRDDLALLLFGPATPTANTSPDFNTATRA